jgi:hypothetical protein
MIMMLTSGSMLAVGLSCTSPVAATALDTPDDLMLEARTTLANTIDEGVMHLATVAAADEVYIGER